MMKMAADRATHTTNSVISSQDVHIEFVKSVIDLKKSSIYDISARIISKWENSVLASSCVLLFGVLFYFLTH